MDEIRNEPHLQLWIPPKPGQEESEVTMWNRLKSTVSSMVDHVRHKINGYEIVNEAGPPRVLLLRKVNKILGKDEARPVLRLRQAKRNIGKGEPLKRDLEVDRISEPRKQLWMPPKTSRKESASLRLVDRIVGKGEAPRRAPKVIRIVGKGEAPRRASKVIGIVGKGETPNRDLEVDRISEPRKQLWIPPKTSRKEADILRIVDSIVGGKREVIDLKFEALLMDDEALLRDLEARTHPKPVDSFCACAQHAYPPRDMC